MESPAAPFELDSLLVAGRTRHAAEITAFVVLWVALGIGFHLSRISLPQSPAGEVPCPPPNEAGANESGPARACGRIQAAETVLPCSRESTSNTAERSMTISGEERIPP